MVDLAAGTATGGAGDDTLSGIEAVIDHQNGWMTSRDRVDVYSTGEPQSAFHARVAFCLDIHNEVRARNPSRLALRAHSGIA